MLVSGVLFRRNYDGVLLRCFPIEKNHGILKEMHEGVCGGQRLLLIALLDYHVTILFSFPFSFSYSIAQWKATRLIHGFSVTRKGSFSHSWSQLLMTFSATLNPSH